MTDSTNPRVMADNIRELSGNVGSQASDIEDLQDDLGTLQTTVGTQGDAIEALGTYSTDEVDTGMLLGEDKIYRKVFMIEHMPNATTTDIPHGITNLGIVVRLYGVVQAGDSEGYMFPYYNTRLVRYTSTLLKVQATTDLSDRSAVVIMEYTKAAANPLTSPAPETRTNEEPEEIREEIPEETPEEDVK